MRASDPRLWLSIVGAVLALFLLLGQLRHTSPGPLNTVHEREPELQGSDGCAGCHGELLQSMREACAQCHADVQASIEERRGLHGTLSGVEPEACALCHIEHRGDALPLAGPLAFARAGVPERERFDHAPLGLTLEGRHAELGCAECHAQAEAVVLGPEERRFIGLRRECDACHEDVHEGRILRACADCHGQLQPFAEVARFEHARGMRLEGAHAGLACDACHEKDGAHAVELLAGAQPPAGERECRDCHASPHAESFLREVADARRTTSGASCVLCHGGVSLAREHAELPRELHAASGFALVAPHAELECARCHTASAAPTSMATADATTPADFATRFPGRAADDCAACHRDPHGGQFAERASDCLACHARERFEPARFDREQHARAGFALDGAHAALECTACHEPVPPGEVQRFRGTPAACAACHADVHEGAFERAGPGEEPQTDCARCHDARDFHVARERFDHGRETGFALDGAHARGACTSCHAPLAEPSRDGRTFARATVLAGHAPGTCSDCHADTHGGVFDRPALPSSLAGRPGCARCHDSEDFAVGATFEHERWTGHALDGAHARAACTSCHTPRPEPDALGRRFGRVAELVEGDVRACASCHRDPHGAAFERAGVPARLEGRSGCARCHGEDTFAALRVPFEHERFTGYPLTRQHAPLACVNCHAPLSVPDARGRRFARAGTACTDCHVDPHAAQFAANGDTRCARCHANDLALVFDHQRDSRFALDERHARLECRACHRPWQLVDGTRAVRYKPLCTTCKDCHGPGG